MKLELGILDFVCIALMFSVSTAIGIYFRFTGGRQKTLNEYLMAGKDMAVLPVAFSLMTTAVSATTMIGLPADVYLYGSQYIFFPLGIFIGVIIISYVYLPVYFEAESTTAYEYLERRFGKTTRIVTSLLFIFQMIFYMSVVLYAPAIAFNAVTGLSVWGSILTLAGVCILYCSLGGLKAVLWTDVFQGMLMFATVIAVLVKGTITVGGLRRVFEIANNGSRLQILNFSPNIEERYTVWNCLISGIIYVLMFFASSQLQIQRLRSIRSLRRARIALYLSTPLMMAFFASCIGMGVVIYTMYSDCDPILDPTKNGTITKIDQLLPYTILKLFSQTPGLSGLFIAGVFSASLSTVSSAVNSISAVIVEDFIRPYSLGQRIKESWMSLLAKFIAIGSGGLCLLMIFVIAQFRGVLEAAIIVHGTFSGPVLGVFTVGQLTTTANELGALTGLLLGFVLTAWMAFGSYITKLKMPHLLRSVDGCSVEAINNNGTFTLAPIITGGIMEFNLTKANNDVFPLYKISYLWFQVFGAVIVVLVAYLSSFIIGCIRGRTYVEPELISPMIRKWLCQSKHDFHNEAELPGTNIGTNKKTAFYVLCNKPRKLT